MHTHTCIHACTHTHTHTHTCTRKRMYTCTHAHTTSLEVHTHSTSPPKPPRSWQVRPERRQPPPNTTQKNTRSFHHKLKYSNREKNWLILIKAFNLLTRKSCSFIEKERAISCNQMSQITIICMLSQARIIMHSTVNTVPHGGQIVNLWGKRWGLEPTLSQSSVQLPSGGQNWDRLYFTSWHSTIWWSDCKLVRKEVGLRVRVDSKSELSSEPSIPPVVPQFTKWWSEFRS